MKRNGFTLIEILVAATIIAILSVIGIVSFNSLNKRSRDAKRRSDLEQVRSALEMFRSDNNAYPGSAASFGDLSPGSLLDTDLVGNKYIPALPEDPQSTAGSPKYYFYSPTGSAPFFSYCLCGTVELPSNQKLDCTPPGGDQNYCVRNP